MKVDPGVWVDTLTDWGIRVILGKHWVAWKLRTGWKCKGRDIGWAEAIVLKLTILLLHHDGYMDCNIVIHGDNAGVIGSFHKGYLWNISHNESLWHISSYIIQATSQSLQY